MTEANTNIDSDENVILATDEIFFGEKTEPAPETDYISIGSRGQVILRRDDQWIKLTPETPMNVTMDTARTIARTQGYYEVEPVNTTGLAMSECPSVDPQQVSIPKYTQDSIGSSSRAPRVDPISRVDPNPDFENWDWPGKAGTAEGDPASAEGAPRAAAC